MINLEDIKVGTKLKVKKLNVKVDMLGKYRCPIGGRDYGITSEMMHLSDKIVTVKKVRKSTDGKSVVIELKEDIRGFNWSLAMFSKNINEPRIFEGKELIKLQHITDDTLPGFLRLKKFIVNGKTTICFFEENYRFGDKREFKVVAKCTDGDFFLASKGLRVCCLKASVKACQRQIDLI